MLLVDDHQAQVLEADVLGEQAVRADHDVDLARSDLRGHLALLLGGSEAREHLDPDREAGQALAEGAVVLLR